MSIFKYLFFISLFCYNPVLGQNSNTLYPFSHLCFLNQTANIANKNCSDTENFIYRMNVITYDAPAKVFLGLTSPWTARCPFGRCKNDTKYYPGYDYTISKGCINNTLSPIHVSRAMTSIQISAPPNTNEQYFITLYKKPTNDECTFLLSKGAFYSKKPGLCTVPQLIKENDYATCALSEASGMEFGTHFFIMVGSASFLLIVIGLLVGYIRAKRKKHRQALDNMYNELDTKKSDGCTQTAQDEHYHKMEDSPDAQQNFVDIDLKLS